MRSIADQLLEDLPREAWAVPDWMTNRDAAQQIVAALRDGRTRMHQTQHATLLVKVEVHGAWPMHLIVTSPRWLRTYQADWVDFLGTSRRDWGQPSVIARVAHPTLQQVVRTLGFLEVGPGLYVFI